MKKMYMLIAALVIGGNVFTQTGVLDQTFGNNGVVTTAFDTTATPTSVVIQPDGKILVAGYEEILGSTSYANVLLARYRPNGNPDSSFGVNGAVKTLLGRVILTGWTSTIQGTPKIALLLNGKFLIGTTVKRSAAAETEMGVIRYNANGSIDSSFGSPGYNGLPMVTAGLNNHNPIHITTMHLKPNGDILLAGREDTFPPNGSTGYSYARAVQLHADGSFDNLFYANTYNSIALWSFLTVTPDNKMFLGYTTNIIKLKSNGVRDSSFGMYHDGMGIFPGLFGLNVPKIVTLTPDSMGRYVALVSCANAGKMEARLCRFNASGIYDPSFGVQGMSTPVIASSDIRPENVLVQADGKYLVTGSLSINTLSTPKYFIARLNRDGSMDNGYGKRGVVIITFPNPVTSFNGYYNMQTASALQPDGKPVLVGGTTPATKAVFTALRLEPDIRIKYNSFYFKTYIDQNLNGIKDPSEPLYPNASATVTKAGASPIFTTSSTGEFYIDVDTGAYTLKVTPSLPYYNVVPAQYTKTFTNYFNEDTFFIGIQPIPGFKDVAVNIIPQIPPRPGNILWHTLQCWNQGTDSVSGSFTYIKDSRVTYIYSDLTPVSIVGDTLHFTYTGLQPRDTLWSNIFFNVPTAPSINIGDTMHSAMNASHIAGETNVADNHSQVSERVRNAWDPNNKTESHAGKITMAHVNNGEYLTYTVHFQNTGNDTALNVYVRDTLDNKLDWSTMQMLTASHNYQMTMNDGKCVWTFNNINLADSNHNEPASHGYIVYRIKPKASVQVGDAIMNSASIYFDYNLPVKTNTETTTVVADILPLKLLTFTAKRIISSSLSLGEGRGEVLLQWSTAHEINADRFEVERSANGREFSEIGSVKSKRENGRSSYELTDKKPETRNVNFYRLKIIDKDGSFTYSPVVQVTFSILNFPFSISVYPNPAKDKLQIEISIDKKTVLKAQVLSQDGKALISQQWNVNEGTAIYPLNVARLQSGTYFLKVTADNKEQSVKFEKQ